MTIRTLKQQMALDAGTVFLNPDEFARDDIAYLASGETVADILTGVFILNEETLSDDEDGDRERMQAHVQLEAAKLPKEPSPKDKVTVDGEQWTVVLWNLVEGMYNLVVERSVRKTHGRKQHRQGGRFRP